MTSGRKVRLVGKAMVINLNNKGGVRKSPGSSKYNSCVAGELRVGKGGFGSRKAQRDAWNKATTKCKGTESKE